MPHVLKHWEIDLKAVMRGCVRGLNPCQATQGPQHLTNLAKAIDKVQVDFGWPDCPATTLISILLHFIDVWMLGLNTVLYYSEYTIT